ncbi:hypothetical protein SAY86_031827 [Trapa natans]|uniref:Uncharacterized protein n=1 Tax=Trapa natans TaxID=22666 RepID=A0AAN7LUU5_TRANT|nr:hypothetical protein SAY86_031827 [Trapa natans]
MPHYHSRYSDRHPDENFFSFCPSRLLRVPRPSKAEPSTNNTSSFRKCSTTATTIKDIFRPPIIATTPSSIELRYSNLRGNLVTLGSEAPTSITFILWTTLPKSRQRSAKLESNLKKLRFPKKHETPNIGG